MQPENETAFPTDCIKCIESQILQITRDTGFGRIEINIERPKNGKGMVAINVLSGVSKRFVYKDQDIQS